MIIYWLYLILGLVSNAFANILIKFAAKRLDKEIFTFKNLIKNFYLISGIFLFGIALIFYTMALRKINLSIGYPVMTSTGFLIVILFSVFYFKEAINFYQILGLLLIVFGLWLVVKNY